MVSHFLVRDQETVSNTGEEKDNIAQLAISEIETILLAVCQY